jgi:hypothetical protein
MKVFVVMANDFPDSVWPTNDQAHAHCKTQHDVNLAEVKQGRARKIYYRVYPFDVRGDTGMVARQLVVICSQFGNENWLYGPWLDYFQGEG